MCAAHIQLLRENKNKFILVCFQSKKVAVSTAYDLRQFCRGRNEYSKDLTPSITDEIIAPYVVLDLGDFWFKATETRMTRYGQNSKDIPRRIYEKTFRIHRLA